MYHTLHVQLQSYSVLVPVYEVITETYIYRERESQGSATVKHSPIVFPLKKNKKNFNVMSTDYGVAT